MLLTQVVLGAALAGLGASNSSRVLITVFGALNTVIAGLVAFLKSRGQPMRARMFRDDLERVVDEIKNSAVMWLGISRNVHGYDAIDTENQITARSEVARLIRLYDRAVKTNTMNDPDMYAAGLPGDPQNAGLRTRPGQPPVPATQAPVPAVDAPGAPAPTPAVTVPAIDPDDSPASKAPEPPKLKATEPLNGSDKAAASADRGTEPLSPPAVNTSATRGETAKPTKTADTAQPAKDPDESPAIAAERTKPCEDGSETHASSDDGKKHSPDDCRSAVSEDKTTSGKENKTPT